MDSPVVWQFATLLLIFQIPFHSHNTGWFENHSHQDSFFLEPALRWAIAMMQSEKYFAYRA